MREIIFRAKTVPSPSRGENNSKWIEGDLAINYWNYSSIKEKCKNGKRHIVIPNTIGQYTGVDDMNDNRIFEGDIIDNYMGKGVVAFDSGSFKIFYIDPACPDDLYDPKSIEVIGNIYDNPEIIDEFQEDDNDFFDTDLYKSIKERK